MLKIHIVRSRQPIGEFTPSEVTEGLKSGQFMTSDLGWREPMDSWLPLSDFPGLIQAEPIQPPPLDMVAAEPAAPSIDEEGPAWERKDEKGILRRLWQTIRQVLVSPTATFRAMKLNGDYVAPLSFFFIVAVICNWVSMGYQAVAMAKGFIPIPSSKEISSNEMVIGMIIASVFVIPMILVVMAFVMSGIFHLLLHAVGGSKKGYEATFRAYCYSFGAASIMLFVPLLGVYVAMGMGVGFFVIGLRELHGITTRRALAGALPVVFAWLVLYVAVIKAAGALSGL